MTTVQGTQRAVEWRRRGIHAWRATRTHVTTAAARLRRPALTATGLGCMAAAAYQVTLGWGLLATGIAVLVFEGLSGGDTG